ncbi:MAG: ATP-binding protein, partial [bacterium]
MRRLRHKAGRARAPAGQDRTVGGAGCAAVSEAWRIERIARPEELPDLLNFVDGACAEARLPDDIAFAVRLATEEACMNVIKHGYRGQLPGPIAIGITRGPSQVVVTIEDRGTEFDPSSVPAPALDACAELRPLGGLGWHLITQSMDEVRHEHDAVKGNTLTLRKCIPSQRIHSGDS